MALVEINAENFRSYVDRDGIVVLDWWAAWCGPCKAFGPVFEAAAAKFPDLTFGKVDTDAQQELAGTFQIRSIPTLMVFRDRVLLFSQPGALPAGALDDLITEAQGLDMAKVLAEIEAQKASEAAPEPEKKLIVTP